MGNDFNCLGLAYGRYDVAVATWTASTLSFFHFGRHVVTVRLQPRDSVLAWMLGTLRRHNLYLRIHVLLRQKSSLFTTAGKCKNKTERDGWLLV